MKEKLTPEVIAILDKLKAMGVAEEMMLESNILKKNQSKNKKDDMNKS